MKVLIVDDEVLVRKGLVMGIEWHKLGFNTVLEANNGLTALELIKEEKPDLVFTDIKMPKMDGLELIDRIKAIYPATVIIVLSCLNDSEVVREAMKFNRALDFIPKLSMSTDELEKIVCMAKSYIHKENEAMKLLKADTISYKTMSQLKKMLEIRDAIGCKKIMKEIIDDLVSKGIEYDDFAGKHELISIFNFELEKNKHSIEDIMIGDNNGLDYLNSVKDLDAFQKKMRYFIDVFFEYLAKTENIQFSDEVNKTIHYIHENYMNQVRLKDIAFMVGLNESYLSRIFKKQMDKTIIEYLNFVRINYSKELLKEQLCLNEIAELVGYSSESYYSRMFKQYEGVSPKKYQKSTLT